VDFFNVPISSSRIMALGSTQVLKEMSTRNLPGGYKQGGHNTQGNWAKTGARKGQMQKQN
jgi:hypothetical protein